MYKIMSVMLSSHLDGNRIKRALRQTLEEERIQRDLEYISNCLKFLVSIYWADGMWKQMTVPIYKIDWKNLRKCKIFNCWEIFVHPYKIISKIPTHSCSFQSSKKKFSPEFLKLCLCDRIQSRIYFFMRNTWSQWILLNNHHFWKKY
jgi:hypothetical protein